jgi:uncharacterized membrane protein YphA (DoxX/SURF4 family)
MILLTSKLNSLKGVLLLALVIRLIAAIFSQGYGMHDDHFVVIETASSWADEIDNSGWLPWSKQSKGSPQGHSFTYVGLNFLVFKLCKLIGIQDPKLLMLINRLIHAIWSVTAVYFGYKITEKISNRASALKVAWLLALLWCLPFLSVRNLVETATIPLLLWGCWLLLDDRRRNRFLYAGLLIGLAVSFRYQVAVFAIAIAGYFIVVRQFKSFIWFSLGITLMFCLTQGIVDFLIWGYPFAEFIGYATYNMNEGTQYLPNTNYFMYFLVLMGVFLFPLGLLMMIGFLRSLKSNALLAIPTLAFILFHSVYPNRQERFILSILPLFIVLGIIGIEQLREKSFWKSASRFSMIAFWIVNIPLLIVVTSTYSKKSRVEAMYALYGNGLTNERILLEGSAETKPSMMPQFYARSWTCKFSERIAAEQSLMGNETKPFDYIFFFGEDHLDQRKKAYLRLYPKLRLVKVCQPSKIDILLRKLNPKNANQYIEVWETQYRIYDSKE